MKERVEKTIEIGFEKSVDSVVNDIEATTQRMASRGFKVVNTNVDDLLKHVSIIFEKEIQEDMLE